MDPTHAIPVRSARDRLIDLLGLGDSYPLTDLPVAAEPVKVTFGDATQVCIDPAQAGVRYQLLGPDGQGLGLADGAGTALRIATPAVLENITFRIRATKILAPPGLPAQAPRLLEGPAPVKVGLDTGLVIRWRDDPGLALLDPDQPDPRPAAARIADHGTQWGVEIEKSQEGVDYTLKLDGRLGQDVIRGDRKTITLPTGPVHEDVVIQVLATKHFPGGEKVTESQDLLARLFLKVRADPALSVTVDGPPIVDHRQDGAVRIAASQASARYQAYLRPVADADFVRDATADPALLAVAVEGQPEVRVRPPLLGDGGAVPEGFVPLAGGPLPGTGADLRLLLPALDRDALVIVQALKDHAVDAGQPALGTRPSARWLGQASLLLVRPDAQRALTLRLDLADGRTGDTLQVAGGQPGVYYHFQPLPDGVAPAWPAYFHQRDAGDAGLNKGLGQLAVEVDFSLTGPPDGPDVQTTDAARSPPPPPRLAITPLPVGQRLAIRALKAQTGVAAPMAQHALIADLAGVRAEPPVIDCGDMARLLIPTPDPLDRYQLWRDGQPVDATPVQADAGLVLSTGPLRADARFVLVARRGEDGGLQVERALAVALQVRPDADLALAAAADRVAAGSGTDLLLQASQRGVDYQLLADGRPAGKPVAGQGGEIRLPTGPLGVDTLYSVVATRSDLPALTVVLKARVRVTVGSA